MARGLEAKVRQRLTICRTTGDHLHCSHSYLRMDAINYHKLPPTPFPRGTYIIVHHGNVPPEGLVLSDVKIVPGWPNPVLEAVRRSTVVPSTWLEIVDLLSVSNDRPDFNIGVFIANGTTHPAAVYGSLESWGAPPSQQDIFRNHLRSVPDNMQHLAHLF